MGYDYPRINSILERVVEVKPLQERRTNMTNYIGHDIGQLLLSNQRDMSDKVAEMSERLVSIEQKINGFEIPSLWARVRSHDKALYMVTGGGVVIGWFAKVLLGK
jgi:hypothetical protein